MSSNEPLFISDPVSERVALSRACTAYLDADIRDPRLIQWVLNIQDAADALLEAMRVDG